MKSRLTLQDQEDPPTGPEIMMLSIGTEGVPDDINLVHTEDARGNERGREKERKRSRKN